MPTLDNLMEQTAGLVTSAEERKAMFSSLDILYANGQPENASKCKTFK